ncbi:MAG TPA: M48 family metallopeptidase [Caulobacteraceae bacterium]|nr:M48 family metallopeptidase [Caulobacteraceae bacterium]
MPRAAWVVLLAVALGGCGAMQPEVELPAAQPTARDTMLAPRNDIDLGGRWDASLDGLRNDDRRVADVAWRIVTANAELCADVAPRSGIVLQSALEYSPRLRPAARVAFGLDDRPAVEAVAAGSPSAVAGVRVGDVLVGVAGRALDHPAAAPTGPDRRPASDRTVEAAQARLTEALAAGPAALDLVRGGAPLRLTIAPRMVCAYDAQVIPGGQLNASADGRQVLISTALVSYARSDEMLALILGHEFAHDVLRHRERLDRVGFARNVLGPLGSNPASLWTAEREADYVGLYLTARAGYDIARAPEFWRRFPQTSGDLGWSHPGAAERVAALTAARDEIAGKIARGEPLIPNVIMGARR